MSLRIREVKNVRSPGMFTNRFDGQAAVAQVLPGFFGAFNLQRQRHTRTPATLNRRLAFIRNTYVGRFRQLKFYKPSGVMGDWYPLVDSSQAMKVCVNKQVFVSIKFVFFRMSSGVLQNRRITIIIIAVILLFTIFVSTVSGKRNPRFDRIIY